jgi:dachs protein
MQLLRQLFDIAGGGSETDAFKHLSATLTVLRSLTSAATITNPDCSRVVSIKISVISQSSESDMSQEL